MANKNQTVAVETEQQLNKTEAFFDKYKKAIIIGVVAVVVLIVGGILINNYYLAPREDAASTELATGSDWFQKSSQRLFFDKGREFGSAVHRSLPG